MCTPITCVDTRSGLLGSNRVPHQRVLFHFQGTKGWENLGRQQSTSISKQGQPSPSSPGPVPSPRCSSSTAPAASVASRGAAVTESLGDPGGPAKTHPPAPEPPLQGPRGLCGDTNGPGMCGQPGGGGRQQHQRQKNFSTLVFVPEMPCRACRVLADTDRRGGIGAYGVFKMDLWPGQVCAAELHPLARVRQAVALVHGADLGEAVPCKHRGEGRRVCGDMELSKKKLRKGPSNVKCEISHLRTVTHDLVIFNVQCQFWCILPPSPETPWDSHCPPCPFFKKDWGLWCLCSQKGDHPCTPGTSTPSTAPRIPWNRNTKRESKST